MMLPLLKAHEFAEEEFCKEVEVTLSHRSFSAALSQGQFGTLDGEWGSFAL